MTSSVLDILFATQDEVVVTPFVADIDEYVAQTRNGEHPVLIIDVAHDTVTVHGWSEDHGLGFDRLSWTDPDLHEIFAEEL